VCCGRAKEWEKESELDGKKGSTGISFIEKIRTALGKVGQKWRFSG
jgi:hypothetical protein